MTAGLGSHQCFWTLTVSFGLWCVLSCIGVVQAGTASSAPVVQVPAADRHNTIRQALSQQESMGDLGFGRDSSYDFSLQPAPAPALIDLADSVALQNAAATHAQSCIFEHFDNAYGENLFAVTGSGWAIEQAISSWALEVEDYDYASLSCAQGGVCGHYTQLVADNISEVGCAIQQCDQMTEAGGSTIFDGRAGLLMVCYYDRIGNITGQPPYQSRPDNELAFKVKVMLQGAYQSAEDMMSLPDVARQLPITEPYSQLGHVVSNNGTLNNALLQATDGDAIVDWVLVELRAAATPSSVLASKPFLVQRDGDLVNPGDASDVLRFAGYAAGNYHLAVRHYNHLGVMTEQALGLSSTPLSIDFSSPSTPVWGEYARFATAGRALLWAGDSNHDGRIIGDGVANDSNAVLQTVLLSAGNTGSSTNYIAQQDNTTDLNMDGQTIYAGVNNDINLIRANVLLHPENTLNIGNFIVSQQLP